jgi:hypothetical protein
MTDDWWIYTVLGLVLVGAFAFGYWLAKKL